MGPGRLGRRLVDRLTTVGYLCQLVRGRSSSAAQRVAAAHGARSDTWSEPDPWPAVRLVVIAVPDAEVAPVAAALAEAGELSGVIVLHTSGLLCSEVLKPCRDRGAAVASWHPLQAFPASASVQVQWEGVACAVEGDPAAVEAGEKLARDLGMAPWRIRPEAKALYHAAATVAANLPHILVVAARRQLDRCSAGAFASGPALARLVRGSIEAALRSDGLEELTGAIARDDRATVARHLEVLPGELAAAYRAIIQVAEVEAAREPSH